MAGEKERLTQEGFTDDEVDAILKRAAELQTQAEREKERMSQEALEAGAKAAGISEDFVEQAIRELKTEREREAAKKAARRKALTIIGIVTAVLFAITALSSHRTLNARFSEVEERQAQLENVLERRHDLIPNLIAIAKMAAAHEKELITSLSETMQKLGQAQGLKERQALEQELSEAAQKLMTAIRANPQTSSTALFIRLSDEMAGAENRIAVERKRYNEAVAVYNQTVRSFPVSLVRPFLGFPKNISYFQASEEAKKPPSF